MEHFGHQLEEEVVGDGKDYAVAGFIYVNRAEIAVVFRYLSRVRRHYLVLSVAHPLIHERASLRSCELIQCSFVYVLVYTLCDGVLPASGLEEHIEDFVFFHNSICLNGLY